MVYATRHPYLHSQSLKMLISHHSLKYLDFQKTLFRRQAVWVKFMQELEGSIKFFNGKKVSAADALSRKESKVHTVSSDIGEKLLVLKTVSVKNETLNTVKSDFEKDKNLKYFFSKARTPKRKICNELYRSKSFVFLTKKLNIKLCTRVTSQL